jgi:hypothetical protein
LQRGAVGTAGRAWSGGDGGFDRSSGGLEDDGNNWLGRMVPGPQRTGRDFLPWAERGGWLIGPQMKSDTTQKEKRECNATLLTESLSSFSADLFYASTLQVQVVVFELTW